MPVCPVTPVCITATGRSRSSPVERAISPPMWRVASTRRLVFGPSESGVISMLPSPATSTSPFTGNSRLISLPTVSSRLSVSVKLSVSDGNSIVMYVPISLPSACLAFWFFTISREISRPFSLYFLNSIPPVFSPAISLASIARSVLNCKIIPRFANLFVYCYYCAILYYVFYLQDYFVLL